MAQRILIAEEDDGVREALAARLRQGGAEVHEAADIESATEILGRKKIDAAVIGLAGFEHKGLDLLKICRAAKPPTEVILLVAKHQGSLAITGMKLGAFRDLQLPIHVESLREIIGQACRARAKSRRRKKKRRIFSALPDVFAAITFAEHGEFKTAEEIRKAKKEAEDED